MLDTVYEYKDHLVKIWKNYSFKLHAMLCFSNLIVVGDFLASLESLMVDAKFHFGTLRYLFIMHTILFTYTAHYLNNK